MEKKKLKIVMRAEVSIDEESGTAQCGIVMDSHEMGPEEIIGVLEDVIRKIKNKAINRNRDTPGRQQDRSHIN